MSTIVTLPANPDLEHLRRQARALQQAVRVGGDAAAAERVDRQHPDGVPDDPGEFQLSTAQLVVAREYGFASWAKLKHYLELVADHGWDTTEPVETATSAQADLADEFCRLACLTYGSDDSPTRREKARHMLAEHPELTSSHVWAAAAATDHHTVARLLADDPSLVRRRGGPYQWSPLCYVAYSRVDLNVPLEPVRSIARLLLDAGADPNEGYLWNGRPYPYTLLTGVFGEGEQGHVNQPRHPHSLPLARMLLDAGADPNDSQALYDRMFRPDNDHLELLFEYGLGRGDGGVWRARLGDIIDPPPGLLRFQLRWAVNHDFLDRLRLLVQHGADFRSAYEDGRTLVELAALDGNTAVVDYLESQGAPASDLDPGSALIAAAFRADRAEVQQLAADHPGLSDEVRRQRPGLMVWAASNGRIDTVRLLAELGFDVNAMGRGDTPIEGPSQTPLHDAAVQGNLELAELLLSLGADPNIHDVAHDATPLGWAQYSGQEAMIELLTPLTNPVGGDRDSDAGEQDQLRDNL